MPTQTYPLDLRTITRSSKSRVHPAAFRMASPRRGMPYAQAIGTVPPPQWDVQFRFTSEESARFMLWFTQVLNGGEFDFLIPLRDEFGVSIHQVQFLPEGLLNCREEGDSFIYDARLVAAT